MESGWQLVPATEPVPFETAGETKPLQRVGVQKVGVPVVRVGPREGEVDDTTTGMERRVIQTLNIRAQLAQRRHCLSCIAKDVHDLEQLHLGPAMAPLMSRLLDLVVHTPNIRRQAQILSWVHLDFIHPPPVLSSATSHDRRSQSCARLRCLS